MVLEVSTLELVLADVHVRDHSLRHSLGKCAPSTDAHIEVLTNVHGPDALLL